MEEGRRGKGRMKLLRNAMKLSKIYKAISKLDMCIVLCYAGYMGLSRWFRGYESDVCSILSAFDDELIFFLRLESTYGGCNCCICKCAVSAIHM